MRTQKYFGFLFFDETTTSFSVKIQTQRNEINFEFLSRLCDWRRCCVLCRKIHKKCWKQNVPSVARGPRWCKTLVYGNVIFTFTLDRSIGYPPTKRVISHKTQGTSRTHTSYLFAVSANAELKFNRFARGATHELKRRVVVDSIHLVQFVR